MTHVILDDAKEVAWEERRENKRRDRKERLREEFRHREYLRSLDLKIKRTNNSRIRTIIANDKRWDWSHAHFCILEVERRYQELYFWSDPEPGWDGPGYTEKMLWYIKGDVLYDLERGSDMEKEAAARFRPFLYLLFESEIYCHADFQRGDLDSFCSTFDPDYHKKRMLYGATTMQQILVAEASTEGNMPQEDNPYVHNPLDVCEAKRRRSEPGRQEKRESHVKIRETDRIAKRADEKRIAEVIEDDGRWDWKFAVFMVQQIDLEWRQLPHDSPWLVRIPQWFADRCIKWRHRKQFLDMHETDEKTVKRAMDINVFYHCLAEKKIYLHKYFALGDLDSFCRLFYKDYRCKQEKYGVATMQEILAAEKGERRRERRRLATTNRKKRKRYKTEIAGCRRLRKELPWKLRSMVRTT